jgi:HPt (histidine-containing phosphotransfer) domain-containing protein
MKMQKANDTATVAHPVLNLAMLDAYARRKTGLLERLIAAYLDEAPRFHQLIRQGIEKEDFELVKLNAHALKSSSCNLGAVRLSKLCQEMESAATRKEGSVMAELLPELGPQCFEVEEGLKTIMLREKAKAVPA